MSNERSIRITKEFPAGKEALYKAWTDPEQLKQWWKPMNKQLQKVENNIRPGGKVAYEFEGDLVVKGEYKEAASGEKLVYSWIWEVPEESMHKGEYLLTIGFSGDGERSTLDVQQESFQDEHAIIPHEDGWQQALEYLRNYLAGGK